MHNFYKNTFVIMENLTSNFGIEDLIEENSQSLKKVDDNVVLSKNIIQLRNGFVNLPDSKCDNKEMATSVASELMQFGYMLDEKAIENISKASKEDISLFLKEVIEYLKIMTGSSRNYVPFWKGFPEQVMDKGEMELWLYQIAHYDSNGDFVPTEFTRERKVAFEHPKYTKLTSGDNDRFLNIFTKLISVNNSLTEDDLDIVEWFVEENQELRFPEQIPFKENLCTLAGLGLEVPVKTVTDVLRIAVYLSDGDISLPKVPAKMIRESAWTTKRIENPAREEFKFANFTRKERRFILTLLERTNCDVSEAVLKSSRWIRLGERLHPGEYKNQFPKSFEFFNSLRNEKVRSWFSSVNKAFDSSLEEGLKKLSERPGEFFRRLDYLIRSNSNQKDLVLKYMNQIGHKVSNKVLFEAYEHFEKRNVDNNNRSIMIKGARNRYKLPDLKALSEHTINSVQNSIKKSLLKKFSELNSLGKVWVDEELKNIPMPKNMRSLSSSLKPIIRGQRTSIGNQNAPVVRAFVHWFDEYGNQDVDLTCVLYGKDKVAHVGWNGGHNKSYGTYSGDIRHRRGACAEYVDIKIEAAINEGFKYAVIDANNFTGRPFHTVDECVVGYMERETPEETKHFVPATIAGCMRLQNESSSTLVSVIDLETREYIHLDIDRRGLPVSSAGFQDILDAIRPYCEAPKFSVYDLVMMHIEARGGELVEKEDAEDTFEYSDFENSYIQTLSLMGI